MEERGHLRSQCKGRIQEMKIRMLEQAKEKGLGSQKTGKRVEVTFPRGGMKL